MNEPSFPLLIIPSFCQKPDGKSVVTLKGLVSSLMKSLFTGSIVVFKNSEMPLYKVERKQLEEVFIPTVVQGRGVAERKAARDFLFDLCTYLNPEERQWVVFADAVGLALRNIDHLVPQDLSGPYAPPELDFLWLPITSSKSSSVAELASPGLWAVRGEHLPLVLERWKSAWNGAIGETPDREIEIWTRVVNDLPLRKRRFERGEVISPRLNAVDWEEVHRAAFITLPDWPDAERSKFLQSLYFGTYLGDETGMILNVLEA